MNSLDINEILKHLPHRYPFILVDRVLDYTPGKTIKALKNISIAEPWFTGHFPENPVMPGVLMLEALAQAAGILAYKTLGTTPDGESLFYLAGFDKVKFKQIVKPGDQLILDIEFRAHKSNIWKTSCKALVDGNVVCTAELTCAYKEISQ